MTGRVGVLGGTFDPVHLGHLAAASAAADALALDRVLLVPAGQPWHREPPMASAADRLAMARLACSADARFEASSVDIDRPGPTFTVDTLTVLDAAEPGTEWHLLLGADALAGLASWREPERIARLATIVGLTRPGEPLADPEVPGVDPVLVEIPPVDLSSTLVREAIAAGGSVDAMLPPAVAAYVREHRLYGAR